MVIERQQNSATLKKKTQAQRLRALTALLKLQIPETTWWLTTIHNEIGRPLLVHLKIATVYLCIIINKSLGLNECSLPKGTGLPERAEVIKIQFPTTK